LIDCLLQVIPNLLYYDVNKNAAGYDMTLTVTSFAQ